MSVLSTRFKEARFNKELIYHRFNNAASSYQTYAIVQKEMAEALVQLAQQYIGLSQRKMFEIGCGTGLLTQEILKHFSSDELTCNDLVDEVAPYVKRLAENYSGKNFYFLGGDAELLPYPCRQDVIWLGATLQWIQDIDRFFLKLSASLNDQGYVVLSSFGPDNYQEIKTTTGMGIEYKTIEQVMASAQNQFELVAKQEWHRTLWFKSPVEVLKHMRLTGVNGVTARRWTRGDLLRFQQNYEQFAQLEGYPLTYHPFLLVLRKNKQTNLINN